MERVSKTVTIEVSFLLDSSLPSAVRTLLGWLRALPPAAAKLATNCMSESPAATRSPE